MDEYIEREAAKKEFALNFGSVSHAVIANRLLDSIPAADVAPVVHGRWVMADDGDGVVCSVCREDFCNIYLETDRFNYCPNCGARMDGDTNG